MNCVFTSENLHSWYWGIIKVARLNKTVIFRKAMHLHLVFIILHFQVLQNYCCSSHLNSSTMS
jgi:hypothetical protein